MREEWKIVRENAYIGDQADPESDMDNVTDLQVCTHIYCNCWEKAMWKIENE